MNKMKSWALLLALASAAPAIAQDYLIPVNASTNPATCGAPPFVVVAQSSGFVSCSRAGYLHWIALGGGWATAFTFSNPTSADMVVQISLLDTNGAAASGAPMLRNGASIGALNADTQLLPKNGTLRYELPNNGSNSQTNGQILVQVLAKDAATLQSVQATEDYTYTSPTGVVYSTVSLPITWTDQAQSAYTAIFEESTATGSLGAFAIKDLTASGQTVDVKAYDISGKLLADKTITLTSGQVMAKTAADLFGASTFQSLAPLPIVSVRITGAGKINVLVLQVRGQSLSAMPATAVLAP